MPESSETCHSRHLSWLVKSCFPQPQDHTTTIHTNKPPNNHRQRTISSTTPTTLSSLPEDLLIDCLSRVPHSYLPSLSLVCRRWARLLLSSTFSHLRNLHGFIHCSLFAFSSTDSGDLFSATLRFDDDNSNVSLSNWKVSTFLSEDPNFHGFPSHVRLSAIGQRIFIIGRNATLLYDTWSGSVVSKSPMSVPRKRFAVASVSGKIYVAGGGPRLTSVEEYDPAMDKWGVVAHASRSRYGCIGASVDGVFYVIGGLKIGGASENNEAGSTRADAHVYASSMDLYDVEARGWLRSRSVPGGGCVVAACAAGGYIYLLTSHAVEMSFWRFDARRKNGNREFGEWCRIRSPPLPAQVRVDGTVRFSCVGVGVKVVMVQVSGCIGDLLRRSERGFKEGLVLIYDPLVGDWTRAPDLPQIIRRAVCVCAEC